MYAYFKLFHYLKGDDYEPGPYIFTIPVEETNILVNISITDDDIVEGNEIFILATDEDSLPNRVMLRQICSIMPVTIVDNDSKLHTYDVHMYVHD